MDLLQVHTRSFLQDVGKRCEAFEATLQAELSSRDDAHAYEQEQRRKEELDFQRRAADCENVEDENRKLRVELDLLRSRVKEQAKCVSLEDHIVIKSQLAEKNREIIRVMRARNMLESRCRRYKEKQKEWRNYCKEWVLKHPQQEQEEIQSFSKSIADQPRDAERLSSSSAPAPPACPTPTSLSDESRLPTPCVLSPLIPTSTKYEVALGPKEVKTPHCSNTDTNSKSPSHAAMTAKSGANTGTETTESSERRSSLVEPNVSQEINDQRSRLYLEDPEPKDSDDKYPIFVSEKILKRRRSAGITGGGLSSIKARAIAEDGPDLNAVKVETLSSSPSQPIKNREASNKVEATLDLDEFQITVDTPRKKRYLKQMETRASRPGSSSSTTWKEWKAMITSPTTDPQDQKNDDSALVKEEDQDNQTRPEIAPTNGNQSLQPFRQQSLTFKEDERRKTRKAERIANQDAHNLRILGSDSGSEKRGAKVLQSKDPNILPRTHDLSDLKPCSPKVQDRGAAHVPALAEDGEKASTFKVAKTPDAYNRLGNLLSEPSRGGRPFLYHLDANSVSANKLQTPLNKSSRVIDALQEAAPLTTPTLRLSKHVYRAGSKSAQSGTISTLGKPKSRKPPVRHWGDFSEGDPKDEPLRARPLVRLSLGDFKLNPKHNDFAYHESVRKHDDKKRLHGCIDPFCDRCKDFQKFVEASGYVAQPKQGLFDSTPPDGAHVDRMILEEYLGEEKHRLRKMSKQDQEALLARAKKETVADAFGKHRQAFPRAKTPPGFWDTGFPSTQEQIENDDAARRIERVKVEERYYEALRGGVWRFADE